jgi:predicted permease
MYVHVLNFTSVCIHHSFSVTPPSLGFRLGYSTEGKQHHYIFSVASVENVLRHPSPACPVTLLLHPSPVCPSDSISVMLLFSLYPPAACVTL